MLALNSHTVGIDSETLNEPLLSEAEAGAATKTDVAQATDRIIGCFMPLYMARSDEETVKCPKPAWSIFTFQ
ncbi:MAG: hypothetical protein H2055_07740 [Sphingopyxis sp.]|nr:hypothetical protein [Sphingopyxis sp.]